MKRFEYTAPTTVEEAARALNSRKAVLSAGGTDLVGVLKAELLPTYPEEVVSLKGIEGLDAIEVVDGELHVGAMATLADIAESPVVRDGWQALADAAKSVASPNIRSTATLGGNICQDVRCWYYRYPNELGGRINCARKTGNLCSAMMGENRYHSIFGAAKICETACTHSCPAHTDIPAYMALIRKGDIDGAARIILEVNPMPAITSRVCAHFCMEGCNRNLFDESLNVGGVERYVGDYILEHASEYMRAPETENGKSVAIVGSGPSGLTAAYYLRQAGYAVTIYERMAEAGGCLSYAIPPYRLPKEVVRSFVAALEAMGIEFKLGVHVGEDIQLEGIVSSHDSVMLDTGTWKRPLIGLAGEELTQFGLDFLVSVNQYLLDKPGARVVVVGGGNVAMDVAVTAKRLGSESVKMVCLEPRDGMPANEEEIQRSLDEDVEIINGWGPKEVLRKDGKVSGIVFKSCPQVLDETGRFNPVYDEDTLMELDADVILMAIGQRADLGFLEGAYDVETERGRIKVLEGNTTSVPGIFAGGDVTTGPATVIKAIAAGLTTAVSINDYCREPELPVELATKERKQAHLIGFDGGVREAHHAAHGELLASSARGIHTEDMGGLTPEKARCEAGRCFNCGCLAVNPSDTATMLLAYGARIVTNQRTMDAKTFFTTSTRVSDLLNKGEIVTEIVVPALPEGAVARYDKYRLRDSIDFAIVAVGSVYRVVDGTVEDASLVLGAVAPIPLKRTAAEDALRGHKLTAELAADAAEKALEGALPLRNNAYKIDIAKTMVRRSLGF